MISRILFVCVQNSCRSQIAEGFARTLGAGIVEPWSAGSKPSGKINPSAIAMMREKGINIAAQASKSLADLPDTTWDFVVTMGCGDACPALAAKRRQDWELPDPKDFPPEEFRKVRDEIERRVVALLNALRRPIP